MATVNERGNRFETNARLINGGIGLYVPREDRPEWLTQGVAVRVLFHATEAEVPATVHNEPDDGNHRLYLRSKDAGLAFEASDADARADVTVTAVEGR